MAIHSSLLLFMWEIMPQQCCERDSRGWRGWGHQIRHWTWTVMIYEMNIWIKWQWQIFQFHHKSCHNHGAFNRLGGNRLMIAQGVEQKGKTSCLEKNLVLTSTQIMVIYTRVVWKVSDLAYNKWETRDKRLLGRDPDRSRCHLHTSLKLFSSRPMAPWTSATAYERVVAQSMDP
jgi:hypothetical protein